MDCGEPADVNVSDEERNVFLSIREGRVADLAALLAAHPDVATSRLGSIGRTPLHVVTDWPGYFPNGPEVAALLIDAGALIDDRGPDGHDETPLHWTASSDDVDVACVLVDRGANIELPDGSIGTPLANAVGYGCWNVARLLVERGARGEDLWIAAGLGLLTSERIGRRWSDPRRA